MADRNPQHTPDLNMVRDALRIAQIGAKPAAESTMQGLKNELKDTTETVHQSAGNVQQNINTGEEARVTAGEASEMGKVVVGIAGEI
ncbi:hypothetical protein BDY21DRAFT_357323 [Lineolata rhizophorae]|uniref:Uncharacterized protein n=1 Tax=Lineolata rhizophorae TaxID=578093 RepID=A0A6A6NN09_9PEZI|nr:hypothetical protein BDY21DRAFT_357323 [Lineolata rhizophorae]